MPWKDGCSHDISVSSPKYGTPNQPSLLSDKDNVSFRKQVLRGARGTPKLLTNLQWSLLRLEYSNANESTRNRNKKLQRKSQLNASETSYWNKCYSSYWKWNFVMIRYVSRSVDWSGGWSVGRYVTKGTKFHFYAPIGEAVYTYLILCNFSMLIYRKHYLDYL